MPSLMGWSSLIETGTSMIKVICSYSFFNWAVTFLRDMFLSYEAVLQLLYKVDCICIELLEPYLYKIIIPISE